MTQHTTVLSLHENQAPQNVQQVLFTSDNDAAGTHPESYWMPLDVYHDLDSPVFIAITVEKTSPPPPPEDQIPLPSEVDTPTPPA